MHMQAAYTMSMVRDLPAYAASDGTTGVPPQVAVACLESFLMHIRVITAFFGRSGKKPHKDDFSAVDLVPGWVATPADAAERLAVHWQTATELVAHPSRGRLQDDPANPVHEDTSYVALKAMADDAQRVWEQFEAAYIAQIAWTTASSETGGS